MTEVEEFLTSLSKTDWFVRPIRPEEIAVQPRCVVTQDDNTIQFDYVMTDEGGYENTNLSLRVRFGSSPNFEVVKSSCNSDPKLFELVSRFYRSASTVYYMFGLSLDSE